MQSIETLKGTLENTRVLVRLDLDVSISSDGVVSEPYRLEASLLTLSFLLANLAHPIIIGHIGRPKDPSNLPKTLSTTNLRPFFDSRLGVGKYTLLENLRADPGELASSQDFAQSLVASTSAELYVNDAFGTSHRHVASITKLPQLLPSYAGLHLLEEIQTLQKVLNTVGRKIIVVGGAKASKKTAIKDLSTIFDVVLVVGKLRPGAGERFPKNVYFPVDYSDHGLDIGSDTVNVYSKMLSGARTIVWAGPAGAYNKGFIRGSKALALAILATSAYSVIGGGDTITCLASLGLLSEFDFVSTGGGAMLDFLAGKHLPGLEALGFYE